MKPVHAFLLVALAVGFSGCANPGVVQLSSDTYMLSRADRAGIFGNTAKLKADVINEANAFAQSKGKVAIPVASEATPVYPGHLATFEYQFRLLDKDDPAAKGVGLVRRPDVVVEKKETVSADIRTRDVSDKQPDLYTEITKLDELRKKGLITDAEFEAEKKRLMERLH